MCHWRYVPNFRSSLKVLSGTRIKFKNQLYIEFLSHLEWNVKSIPLHIIHNHTDMYIKACFKITEWNKAGPLAFVMYNFLPKCPFQGESFLMFGSDPYIPLNSLLNPKVKYLGIEENTLSQEALKNIYHVVAANLELA